jgi:hypothetical protein
VPINYEAVATGRDILDNAPGTFFSRPAVTEVKIFFTFDEESAARISELCRAQAMPLAAIAEGSGVSVDKSGNPGNNCVLNPNTPVVVRNPHGVTTHDVAACLKFWLVLSFAVLISGFSWALINHPCCGFVRR